MNYNSGEQFVDKLYNNLINEEEVKKAIKKVIIKYQVEKIC